MRKLYSEVKKSLQKLLLVYKDRLEPTLVCEGNVTILHLGEMNRKILAEVDWQLTVHTDIIHDDLQKM